MPPIINKSQRRAATVEETAQDLKDGLWTTMNDSVHRVRGIADKFEGEYYRPAAARTHDFASENPVVFTFFVIFGVLSVIPISIFLGFVAFFISLLVFGAAVFLLMSISTVLVISTTILFPILFLTASLALFATTTLIGSFLLTRLYILTRDHEYSLTAGIGAFVRETGSRVGLPLPEENVDVGVDIVVGHPRDEKPIAAVGSTKALDSNEHADRTATPLLNGDVKLEQPEAHVQAKRYEVELGSAGTGFGLKTPDLDGGESGVIGGADGSEAGYEKVRGF